jgi:hypothetical protein
MLRGELGQGPQLRQAAKGLRIKTNHYWFDDETHRALS